MGAIRLRGGRGTPSQLKGFVLFRDRAVLTVFLAFAW